MPYAEQANKRVCQDGLTCTGRLNMAACRAALQYRGSEVKAELRFAFAIVPFGKG